MMIQADISAVRTTTRREFACRAAIAAAGLPLASSFSEAGPAERLRAAVVGHTGRGDYGHGLDAIFNNRPDVQLVALADPDAEGRAKTAAKIGALRRYADYREMLEKERPQLVSVAMRHADQHHAIVLAALKAGAHVYCEKPFTATPAEADELLQAARERSLKIAVAHMLRLLTPIVQLRQTIREGLIGELIQMRAFGKQDTRAGGEDMMVLGSHLFDLMRMFAGDPLWCSAHVLWKGRDILPTDGRAVADNVGLVAGDEVFAQFTFSNGVNATFTSAARLRETTGNWGIEFFGSKGVARINCDISPNVFVRRTTPWTAEGKADEWKPLDPSMLRSPPARSLNPVSDWLESIAENREPECSGRNGAWAVEMVMGVYHAALQGRRIPFPLTQRPHALATVP